MDNPVSESVVTGTGRSNSRTRLLRVPPRNPLGQTVDSHVM
jgi:hypothetical protein